MGNRISGFVMAAASLALVLALPSLRVAAQTPAAGSSAGVSSGGDLTVLGKWNVSGGAGEGGYSIEGGRLEEETKIMGVRSVAKTIVVDPPDGKIPFQPWSLAFRNDRWQKSFQPKVSRDLDPNSKCYPSGVPHVMLRDGPLITRTPEAVLMQFEFGHQYRIIYTDGRPHLPSDIKLWYGDSRGHFEGNTLVTDVTNLNAFAWLGIVGDFFSENAHLTERFTPVDANTLKYEIRIDDPGLFTRPWTIGFNYVKNNPRPAAPDPQGALAVPFFAPQVEIWEHACHEGNRNIVWREIAKQVGRVEAQPPKDHAGPIKESE